MKGIVFNEFMVMVEKEFGAEMVELIIEDANPASGAAYTNVGTYDHGEIVDLVVALSKRTGADAPALIKAFGKFLFHSFGGRHGDMIASYTNGFDLLKDIHGHIHVEVEKLYSNAQLPHFSTEQQDDSSLKMVYTSERKMSDLAEGLIEETMAHFGHDYSLEKNLVKDDGSVVEFFIKLN